MAKIAIDCGHSRVTAGKRCLKSLDSNETREWVLNDRVGDSLEQTLKSAGHTVLRVDDVDGSTDVPLADRVKKASNWGADAYISVHHNAGVNGGSGGGTVVYIAKSCSSKSVKMQEAVYKHAIADCKLKGNRYDGTLASDFYVIKNTKMPAILIECGFMDSATDIKYILDQDWSKKMGVAIAKGICEVFGGSVNVKSEFQPYKVRVTANKLNIRAGAGTNYDITGAIEDKGIYTIVEEKMNGSTKWGKLKSGVGYISLAYTEKV